jgi:RimJ/RimL family protein N-acetyltransferase
MVGATIEEIVPSLGLPEVEAVIARGNARSQRLLERLGFRFSGLGRIACRRSTATIAALNYRKHIAYIAAHCSREERHV